MRLTLASISLSRRATAFIASRTCVNYHHGDDNDVIPSTGTTIHIIWSIFFYLQGEFRMQEVVGFIEEMNEAMTLYEPTSDSFEPQPVIHLNPALHACPWHIQRAVIS
jgi:hypothetical protein